MYSFIFLNARMLLPGKGDYVSVDRDELNLAPQLFSISLQN